MTLDGSHADSLASPAGQGWLEIGLFANGSTPTLGIWYKLATSELPSHTWTWSGSEHAYGYIMRFTGHDTMGPIDASVVSLGGSGTSASPPAPALTANLSGSLILRVGGFDDDDVAIGDAGVAGHTTITMNESSSGSGTCASGAAWAVRGASPSVPAANFTLTAGEQWITASIAIAPGAPPQVCGNGVVEPGEDCDDSNTADGDCCSSMCLFEPAASPCDDSVSCTETDGCDGAGVCGGTANDGLCEDLNICTDDSCDALLDCQFAPNTVACDDGVSCTGNDSCSSGACAGVPSEDLCNDLNLCTTDSCDPILDCQYLFNDRPCDDGISCTASDTCSGGSCQSGTPSDALCDDLNACTDDICDAVLDCQYTNNTGPCDSGLECSANDTCGSGICQLGADDVSLCDDGDICTTETCTAGLCTFAAEPDTDGDGVCDLEDNCVHRANPGQEDEGDVGPVDPLGSPDGIGDACQCGDLTFNHFVDFFDALAIRFLSVEVQSFAAADLERCSAIGDPDSCNAVDVVVISRSSESPSQGPGVTQGCRAAVGP